MEAKEGIKIRGWVIAEELVPGTDIVLSREEGENIICAGGADAIATALTTGTLTEFPYMVTSDSEAAVARVTAAIPAVRTISTLITPTVDNTPPTSITTWVYTFAAQAGATTTWQFGMESATPSGGSLWNQYKFTVSKDNWNNDLKLTYNVSIAP